MHRHSSTTPFVDISSLTVSLSSLSPQLHHFLAHDWLRLDSSGKEPVNLALVEEGSTEHMQARAEDRVGVQYSHVADPVQWEAVKVCSSHSHCAHCVLVISRQLLLLGTGCVPCSCWERGCVSSSECCLCAGYNWQLELCCNWQCVDFGTLREGISAGHQHKLDG